LASLKKVKEKVLDSQKRRLKRNLEVIEAIEKGIVISKDQQGMPL
jgi:hypothetical protein